MNGDPTMDWRVFRRVRIHAHLLTYANQCLTERHYAMNGDPTRYATFCCLSVIIVALFSSESDHVFFTARNRGAQAADEA